MDAGETVWVVGGGITAAQFATSIADHADITLCTRHPLRTALREADPRR
jgi:cation diffusion facilitator CzcD-associated flavoprotein CzcO